MKSVAVLAPLILCTALAAAGPEWPEAGDAGPLPISAQTVTGAGPLSKITGRLNGMPPLPSRGVGDFQDMYLIRIIDPMNFMASTDILNGGFADFDANLFLFELDGRGLLGNIGLGSNATLTSASNDGSGAELDAPGDYYLAISGGFSVPADGFFEIFDFNAPGEISGPDGLGGPFPINNWIGPTQTGDYEIAIQGAIFIPAPATLALMLLAPVLSRRQR
jgi:hypothetical protein